LIGELTLPLERKIPSVDVLEHDDEITVKAELPGVEKKDLDISLTNNSVTIKGNTSHEEKNKRVIITVVKYQKGFICAA